MRLLSDVEAKIGIVETGVVNFFSTTLPKLETWVETEIEGIAGEFDNVLIWLGAHGQEIATDVEGVLGVAAAINPAISPAVLAAQAALNVAVGLVNAAVAARQASAASGGTNLQQAVAAGGAAYQALKSAQASTAVAQSITAVAPPVANPAP